MTGAPIDNPYAGPTDQLQHASPAAEGARVRALFTPRQLLACTLVGTLFAGVFALWLNYRALGQTGRARRALALGLLAAAAWFAVRLSLPRRIPGGLFEFVQDLQFYGFCNAVQGPEVFRRLGAGTPKISNASVFALCIGGWLLVGIAAAVAGLL
ncbi:MAG TPA: hypothetical protein VIF57_11235 [Polyangia bacterium]|jgi:hypothetical protein